MGNPRIADRQSRSIYKSAAMIAAQRNLRGTDKARFLTFDRIDIRFGTTGLSDSFEYLGFCYIGVVISVNHDEEECPRVSHSASSRMTPSFFR